VPEAGEVRGDVRLGAAGVDAEGVRRLDRQRIRRGDDGSASPIATISGDGSTTPIVECRSSARTCRRATRRRSGCGTRDRLLRSDAASATPGADAEEIDGDGTAVLVLAALHGGSILCHVAQDPWPLNAALDLALAPLMRFLGGPPIVDERARAEQSRLAPMVPISSTI
jgi:hypothetical protein